MKTSLVSITLAALLISLSLQQVPSGYTPIMITELWRHGVRAAAYNTFNQDYVDREGPGNLMANGMRMHYNLGRAIREMYKDSIFKDPKYTDFKILSTTYQRTILSAVSHLTGIYPPGTGKVITNSIASTKLPPFSGATDDATLGNDALPNRLNPIPIVTYPPIMDDYFMKGMSQVCPKADERKDAIFAENIKNKPNIFDSVIPTIEKNYKCGDYFKGGKWDLRTVGIFSDVNKCNYFQTGQWMTGTESIADKMKYIFGIYYINAKYTDINIRKLYTTKMSLDIIQNFEMKIKGENKLKFLGLSCHESNIFPYMMGYDLISEECLVKKMKGEPVQGVCEGSPEFASNIILELTRNGNDHYVRVLYDGKPIRTTCASDKLVDGVYCKFEDFKQKFLSTFTLNEAEYKETCGRRLNPDGTHSAWEGWMWVALVMTIVAFVSFTLLITTFRKQGSDDSMSPNLNIDEESYSKL